jgi:predicted amidohydrolase
MRLAIAQFAPTPGDVHSNLRRSRELVAEAVTARAEFVVFPELSLHGYLAEDVTISATDQRLTAISAGAAHVAVLLGFAESAGVSRYNSAALVADGELRHVHRKLILPSYGPFAEHKRFSPGDALRAFDTPPCRTAVLLCEDVVQPALATIAAHDGAEVLLIPANSAYSLLSEVNHHEHWRAVTSFYARLTQSVVVFANRVGTEGNFRFWGGSHVLGPAGEILAEARRDDEELLLVDIDLAAVERQRDAVPLLRNARLDIVIQELTRLSHRPCPDPPLDAQFRPSPPP